LYFNLLGLVVRCGLHVSSSSINNITESSGTTAMTTTSDATRRKSTSLMSVTRQQLRANDYLRRDRAAKPAI